MKIFVHIAANTVGDQPVPGVINTLCNKEVAEQIVDLPAGEIEICPECSKALREKGVISQMILVLDSPPPKSNKVN